MALATQGFSLSALPTTPQVPGNLGVVAPPIDPSLVLALTRQNLAARQQQDELQTAAQNRALAAQQASQQAQAFSTAAPQRALAAQAAQAQSGLLPGQTALSAANTAAQSSLLPGQTALAGATEARNLSLVGPQSTTQTTGFDPDTGLYTTNESVTSNGTPVSTKSVVSPLLPGASASAQALRPAPVYDINTGAERSVLRNIRGDYIDPETHQPVDFTQYTLTAPTKASVAGAIATAKVPAAAQQALSKSDVQDISDYPSEQQKLANAATALAAEQNSIEDAKKLAASYSGPDFLRSIAAQVPGTDSFNLAAKLKSIQGASGAQVLANVKNVRSLSEYNGLTQALGSLALAQNPADLTASLDSYSQAATQAYAAAKNSIESRHAQALQRLGQYANVLGGAATAPADAQTAPNATQSAPAAPLSIRDKAGFDSLPSGATYINANNGQTYQKP